MRHGTGRKQPQRSAGGWLDQVQLGLSVRASSGLAEVHKEALSGEVGRDRHERERMDWNEPLQVEFDNLVDDFVATGVRVTVGNKKDRIGHLGVLDESIFQGLAAIGGPARDQVIQIDEASVDVLLRRRLELLKHLEDLRGEVQYIEGGGVLEGLEERPQEGQQVVPFTDHPGDGGYHLVVHRSTHINHKQEAGHRRRCRREQRYIVRVGRAIWRFVQQRDEAVVVGISVIFEKALVLPRVAGGPALLRRPGGEHDPLVGHRDAFLLLDVLFDAVDGQ
eukprot:NODE_1262_length_1016_cov_404.749741_g878_i0.p1 GENE.NODE_1262_length_1016_cov_404.749741_g878_i0~~NODE_1262_length_1016_cov_404.749741_g878_i0.p1  ORF type:complete len:293 (-),score=94.75 NODE_1262_length_1016_cov_404.749741_g878_i0:138-971(-)